MARRQLRRRPDEGRPLQPAHHQIPQLDHARRQPGPLRHRRLPGRARPLSPLCVARLPVGAPHHHLPPAQAAREHRLHVGDLVAHGRERLDLRHRRGLERRRASTARRACPRSICSPIRNTPAASACRCCGTRSARPSSATSRPRSSGCSIRRSTPSPTSTPTTIRRTCAARSTRSTSWSTPMSTTASIAQASPPRSRPTRTRSATCSRRSTNWSADCRGSATSRARA